MFKKFGLIDQEAMKYFIIGIPIYRMGRSFLFGLSYGNKKKNINEFEEAYSVLREIDSGEPDFNEEHKRG